MPVLEAEGCGGGWGPHLPAGGAAPCPLLKPVAVGTTRLECVAGRRRPGSTHREEGSDEGLQH